jgi:hypothetical protein
MRTVYKYPLNNIGENELKLHRGFQIIHAGEQDGVVNLWVDSRTDNQKDDVTIVIYGTGHQMSEYAQEHIQSVQMSNGLVWHIYRQW